MSQPSSPAPVEFTPVKVLIVEDSPTQGVRMRIALESQGFCVLVSADSRHAVDVARQEAPDLVLSNVRMPGVDGFQLCRFFRRDRQLRSITFVLHMTRSIEDEDRALSTRVGAHGLIQKGLRPVALADELRAALARTAPAA